MKNHTQLHVWFLTEFKLQDWILITVKHVWIWNNLADSAIVNLHERCGELNKDFKIKSFSCVT